MQHIQLQLQLIAAPGERKLTACTVAAAGTRPADADDRQALAAFYAVSTHPAPASSIQSTPSLQQLSSDHKHPASAPNPPSVCPATQVPHVLRRHIALLLTYVSILTYTVNSSAGRAQPPPQLTLTLPSHSLQRPATPPASVAQLLPPDRMEGDEGCHPPRLPPPPPPPPPPHRFQPCFGPTHSTPFWPILYSPLLYRVSSALRQSRAAHSQLHLEPRSRYLAPL